MKMLMLLRCATARETAAGTLRKCRPLGRWRRSGRRMESLREVHRCMAAKRRPLARPRQSNTSRRLAGTFDHPVGPRAACCVSPLTGYGVPGNKGGICSFDD